MTDIDTNFETNLDKKSGWLKKLLIRLKFRYRLIVYNDTTYEEVSQFALTKLNVFAYLGFTIIVLAAIVLLSFAYTPLNVFMPYRDDTELKHQAELTVMRLDSLEQELLSKDLYLRNIKTIISGGIPDSFYTARDKNIKYGEIPLGKSENESDLVKDIEETEEHNILADETAKSGAIHKLLFISPVRGGIITNTFNEREKHYAVDLVAKKDEPVLSVLDGTVTMASWTLLTGYVIQIQHDNNLVTFYKHNSSLLKKVGTRVKSGESIAIIGNSGELSTGPHLHFELWHNGVPLNPEEFIAF